VHNFQGIEFSKITPLEHAGYIVTDTVGDMLVTRKKTVFSSEVPIFCI
jgi:hypothetical protein